MFRPAVLYAEPTTAARVEEILGLFQDDVGLRRPGEGWGDLEISVPLNDAATVTITFHITAEQLVELAALTVRDDS